MQPYIRNFSSLYIDTTIIQWYVEQFFFLFCSLSSTTLNKCLTFIRNCSHALDQRRSRFNIYPWNPPCIPWQSCISIDPQGYDEHHQQPPTTNNNINRANKKKKIDSSIQFAYEFKSICNWQVGQNIVAIWIRVKLFMVKCVISCCFLTCRNFVSSQSCIISVCHVGCLHERPKCFARAVAWMCAVWFVWLFVAYPSICTPSHPADGQFALCPPLEDFPSFCLVAVVLHNNNNKNLICSTEINQKKIKA